MGGRKVETVVDHRSSWDSGEGSGFVVALFFLGHFWVFFAAKVERGEPTGFYIGSLVLKLWKCPLDSNFLGEFLVIFNVIASQHNIITSSYSFAKRRIATTFVTYMSYYWIVWDYIPSLKEGVYLQTIQ